MEDTISATEARTHFSEIMRRAKRNVGFYRFLNFGVRVLYN